MVERSLDERITPTCVGRTFSRTSGRHRSADHPHVRGEDSGSVDPRSPAKGSPPRAWGGRPEHDGGEVAHRITPTCVGRTPCPRCPCPSRTDHPHVRGEDAP